MLRNHSNNYNNTSLQIHLMFHSSLVWIRLIIRKSANEMQYIWLYLSYKIMFYISITNLCTWAKPLFINATYTEDFNVFIFMWSKEKQNIHTNKLDTSLSFLTAYMQMESIALNVVRHRKMTTLDIGRNFRRLISQKLKVQWGSPEAIESRGGMTEFHHLLVMFRQKHNVLACYSS